MQSIDVFSQTAFPLTTLHVEPKEQRNIVQRGISKKETNRISQIVLYRKIKRSVLLPILGVYNVSSGCLREKHEINLKTQ